jgi:hypothetical protein
MEHKIVGFRICLTRNFLVPNQEEVHFGPIFEKPGCDLSINTEIEDLAGPIWSLHTTRTRASKRCGDETAIEPTKTCYNISVI